MAFIIKVNGQTQSVDVDGDTPLLRVLRRRRREPLPRPSSTSPAADPLTGI
jgi:aerobic-type carbon monoxide dehydrogenase small subunit (CoxS/CutS family)